MTERKRDCAKCIAYCNLLSGEDYRCGLGFEVVEELETQGKKMGIAVHPLDDGCKDIELPSTKEEFVNTATKLGIKWDIDDVLDSDDLENW